MLRAVAVVQVPVDDQDALEAVFFLCIGGSDGDVVEEAEAHGPVGFGMVAREGGQRRMTESDAEMRSDGVPE